MLRAVAHPYARDPSTGLATSNQPLARVGCRECHLRAPPHRSQDGRSLRCPAERWLSATCETATDRRRVPLAGSACARTAFSLDYPSAQYSGLGVRWLFFWRTDDYSIAGPSVCRDAGVGCGPIGT